MTHWQAAVTSLAVPASATTAASESRVNLNSEWNASLSGTVTVTVTSLRLTSYYSAPQPRSSSLSIQARLVTVFAAAVQPHASETGVPVSHGQTRIPAESSGQPAGPALAAARRGP
jgi:hypothetical protein